MAYRQTARSEAVRKKSRERILRAAFKLFAKQGYDATTMQEIVAAAGTSIGNAYFYFGSKEQLAREVIESVTGSLLDESEELGAEVPPGPARIARIIVTRIDALLTVKRDFAQLIVNTDQRLGAIDIMEDMTIARWMPILEECLPDRDPSELPAIAAAIWGVGRSFVSRAVRDKLQMDRVPSLEFVVGWTLRALSVPEPEIESILREVLPRDGED